MFDVLRIWFWSWHGWKCPWCLARIGVATQTSLYHNQAAWHHCAECGWRQRWRIQDVGPVLVGSSAPPEVP